MANYPTQLDEIDQWLADNFGILPGACSSTENLRHNTARMIAEALWPKCKDSLHIPETCKENGDSFTDEADSKKDSGDSKNSNDLEEAAEEWCKENHKGIALAGDKKSHYLADGLDAFIAGANWQKEQDHDACYQCEKNYDTVFYKGEQHAIKMMEKETISGEVVQNYSGEYALYIKAKLPKGTYLKFGDKVPVYIFKKNTL